MEDSFLTSTIDIGGNSAILDFTNKFNAIKTDKPYFVSAIAPKNNDNFRCDDQISFSTLKKGANHLAH